MTPGRHALGDLHEHVCGPYDETLDGQLRDCCADESDERESGVCSAWDALRDAYARGRRDEMEERARS